MTRRGVFAIPGELDALTGGYIYEKQVLFGLRRQGWDMTHLTLPGSFPDPTPEDVRITEQALAALSPDIPILLDGFLTGAMPPDAMARLRAPFVAITHHPLAYETGLSADRSDYLKRVERANLARAAQVIVPSPHTARMLEKDFAIAAERITVASPGITPPQNDAPSSSSMPEILVVGQLVPRKGHDTLIKALATLVDLDWTASIVGPASDPAHAAELSRLVADLRLEDRLTIVGILAPEELKKRYAQASVFALATHYEGYGMVFAEAMAHGLPIVSCAGGAVPDTVPDDAGVLVAPEDVPAFAAALRRVLSDEDFRHGLTRASRAHGKNLPSWDDTARTIGRALSRVADQTCNCSGA